MSQGVIAPVLAEERSYCCCPKQFLFSKPNRDVLPILDLKGFNKSTLISDRFDRRTSCCPCMSRIYAYTSLFSNLTNGFCDLQ